MESKVLELLKPEVNISDNEVEVKLLILNGNKVECVLVADCRIENDTTIVHIDCINDSENVQYSIWK